MAISVDYTVIPWLITIPITDLTLESGTKYNLNVDTFWQLLRDYADSPDGMILPVVYTRTAATASTPSITEVNEDYYELQFEDGLYSVNIINGNTNIRNVEVKNQVSVNTNNTTGFINPTFLESGLFNDKVTIDFNNGYSGTTYTSSGGIIGTRQTPSNNLSDAKTIAVSRGINTLLFIGNFTFSPTDNVDNYILLGEGPPLSEFTFSTGVSTVRTIVKNCHILGEISGAADISDCHVEGLSGVGGTLIGTNLNRCILEADSGDAMILSETATEHIHIVSCSSGSIGDIPANINCNGSAAGITLSYWGGGLKFRNMTSSDQKISLDSSGGDLIIDSTCTAGTIIILGDTKVTDNSDGAVTVKDRTTANLTWMNLKALTLGRFLGLK